MTVRQGMQEYFRGDTYTTRSDMRRDLGDRLCFGGTLWFYLLHSQILLRSRSMALNGSYDDAAWAGTSHDILRVLERCGGRLHVVGLDHLRHAEGACVFIGNHMSTIETQVLPCLIAPIMPVTFIVKRSLVTMPFFGPIMRSRNPITVGRENPREDMMTVMTEGTKRLQSGTSVIVFPQATRYPDFDPAKFNSLGVKLAKRAGVQVVPMAVKTDFWTPGRGAMKNFGPLYRSLPIHLEFGTPMTVTGNGKEQHEKVVRFIGDRLDKWGGQVVTEESANRAAEMNG